MIKGLTTEPTLPVILCVDDDAIALQHLLQQITGEFGDVFEIVAACSGEEAIEAASGIHERGGVLALVLSDLVMPQMNGDECLARMHASYPEAVKILLTGMDAANESIINAINNADLYRYITKPWAVKELLVTVGEGLEKYRLVSRLQQQIDAQTSEIFRKHEELQRKHQQLKEAQTRLVQSEKIAALGILLAGVAHEIKNPAQFAHSGALNLRRRLDQLYEFLLMMAGEEADPQLLSLLEEKFLPLFQNMDAIEDGTNRIQLLAGNLHTFSRLSDSDTKASIHLSSGLKSTLLLVEANYRERVEFLVDVAFDPFIKASSAQMNQVFMNVIVNACQAITSRQDAQGNRKRGCLKIRTFKVSNAQIGLSFEDDGCGIPEENWERVFEPFFSTKPEGQGTGLGLSITTNIIKEHGGEIEMDSRVGEGTKLLILLPVTPGGEAPGEG